MRTPVARYGSPPLRRDAPCSRYSSARAATPYMPPRESRSPLQGSNFEPGALIPLVGAKPKKKAIRRTCAGGNYSLEARSHMNILEKHIHTQRINTHVHDHTSRSTCYWCKQTHTRTLSPRTNTGDDEKIFFFLCLPLESYSSDFFNI